MKYRMINKELQIASYKLSEMTAAETREFLDRWTPETELSKIPMYLDREKGVLVLNSEHERYAYFLQTAVSYLTADDKKRELCRDNSPGSMKRMLQLFEQCHDYIVTNELIEKAEYAGMDEDNRRCVNVVFSKYDPYIAVSVAYNAGIIYGKRIERKRRKDGALNDRL